MITFLLLLLFSVKAWSLESEFSGKLWLSELRIKDKPVEDKTQSQGGGFLQNKISFSESLSVKTELLGYYIHSPKLMAPQKNLSQGDQFFEINELYLRWEKNGLTLKAGQQTTSWGKSDGLNPTDFLTGRRNILMGADDLLTRRGHSSAMLEWIPHGGDSSWNFQQWVVFRHATTDVLFNSGLTRGVIELENNRHREQAEFATKLSYQGSGFELEYIYFYGLHKTPLFIEEARSFSPLKIYISPLYLRQEAHGINMVKDFTDFIFRLEAAYIRRLDIDISDYINNPDRLDVVLGLERSFFENHRFNFQLVGHHYLDYQTQFSSDQIRQQVQLINRTLQAQHQQTRIGHLITYQFEPSEMNQWKLRLTWLNYLYDESSSILNPQIEYEIAQGLRTQFFALIFDGERRTPLGVLNDLSSVGISLNYNF
jgi:hypothetical protein